MLKKHLLVASIALISTTLYAIPIESRNLSATNSNTQNNPAYNTNSNTALANNIVNDEPVVSTNLNWQLMQKNQQLENDIRTLRGQLEEHENEIDKLNSELSNRYTDLDQRLELLQQQIEPPEPTETTDTSATDTSDAAIDANATPEQSTTSSNPTSAADLEKAAYIIALDAYKQGGAQKAIAPMENFIKSNPNSVYIANAYFWLAEFHLASTQINYVEAKKNYSIVANRYPQSNKAPRSLYQLYNIASNVDKDLAQATQYKSTLIERYPASEEAGFFK